MNIPDPDSVTSSDSRQSVIPTAGPALAPAEMARLEHRLVQAMQKIIAAYADAERAKAVQAQSMAVACHDLRQPLQALALLLEALKCEVAGTRLEKIADTMQEATDDLNLLLDKMGKIADMDMKRVVPTGKEASQQVTVSSERR